MDSELIVRSDHSELLPQSSGKRGGRSNLIIGIWRKGGGAGSHFISPVWGEVEGRVRGNRRSYQDYQDYKEKRDHSHMESDRVSIYLEKTT